MSGDYFFFTPSFLEQCENHSESERTGLGESVRRCPVQVHCGVNYVKPDGSMLDSPSLMQTVPGQGFPTHQKDFPNV